MSEPRDPHIGDDPDPDSEHALADALGRSPLGPEQLARIRAVVEAEWRAAHPAPAARRTRNAWLAIAAGVVAAVIVGYALRPSAAPPAIGGIARLDRGGADVRWMHVRHRAARPGDPLRVGDRLIANGPVLVVLSDGGSLRIAGGTELEVEDAHRLSLAHGLIYVETPPGAVAAGGLRILTRAGAIEHLGTQFEVLSDATMVRVRVREGRIRLSGRDGGIEAAIGTELVVQPGGRVTAGHVPTFGRDWLWIAALAPDFEIEGRPLAEFLEWAGRELGRRIDFGDARARAVAGRTILHGSIRGRAPLEALGNVLATTSLTYEILGDTIRVDSAP